MVVHDRLEDYDSILNAEVWMKYTISSATDLILESFISLVGDPKYIFINLLQGQDIEEGSNL